MEIRSRLHERLQDSSGALEWSIVHGEPAGLPRQLVRLSLKPVALQGVNMTQHTPESIHGHICNTLKKSGAGISADQSAVLAGCLMVWLPMYAEQQRDELLEEFKSRCLHTHYCKLGRVAYVKYSDQSSCTCGLTEAITKAQGAV